MSIKQEKVTEVRVVAIISRLVCDACGAVMEEKTTKTGYASEEDTFDVCFELNRGWVEIVKGQYGNRTKNHACGKCLDTRVGALLGAAT